LLGKKAELTVIHNTSKTGVDYDVIDYISMSNHDNDLVNNLQKYFIQEHSETAFNELYKRQQEIIEASPEFKKKDIDETDNLPF